MNPNDCYTNAYYHGWNGIFAWTSNGVDTFGDLNKFSEGARKIGGYLNW